MSYRFKYGDRPLDDYTIQRAVGSGGFGEVYYAVSDGGREVALKYLRQNPESELRGVSHCINLKSPHLVSIFDVKKNADGDYFIIMEYCSGPSLRDLLIAEPNGFPQEKAAFFIREIAKGLAYLHDRGIVHRDLKPGNIFYDDGYVKIGDYGLSKFISVSRHSAQTASVGTVHYMAPEIGSGNYSRGVDIYALGVMLYEMLLGKVPFEGSSMAEILMKHLTSQPEVDELPEPFTKIIRRALAKDPDDRYQNVNEMVDDLLSVEQVQSSLAGFRPQSLDGAVRKAVHADSPIPSPNPAPHPQAVDAADGVPFNLDLRDVERLPGRVNRRLDKINKRFGKRMARLARDVPQPSQTAGDSPAAGIAHNAPRQPLNSRQKRMIPALLLTFGLAIGVSVLFGANVREEIGIGAGFLVIAMSLGTGLARKAQRWFGDENLPGWVVCLMSGVVCAPLLFVAGAPMCDYSSLYLGTVGGLLVSILFANWDSVRDTGAEGSLGLGRAIWIGFGAGLAGAVISSIVDDGRYGDMAFLAAGAIAAAAAIVVQANCWWLVGTRGPRNRRPRRATRLNRPDSGPSALRKDDLEGAEYPVDQAGVCRTD
ncbi:MAG: serine/threonine protein kinase [Phycisphaerae bacterium]